MATVHQFIANIANAQLSTGPRTKEGTPRIEIDKTKPIQSLNSRCDCGSGLKYKRCGGAHGLQSPHVIKEG